jgi:diguanylate cyclase (GGDEF)-like protein
MESSAEMTDKNHINQHLMEKNREELEHLLQTTRDYGIKCDALLVLSSKLWDSAPDNARIFAEQSLQISRENNDSWRIGNALIHLGILHGKKGNVIDAVDNLETALEIKTAVGDMQAVSMCYNNLALVYKKQGDFSRALELLHKSLTIKEELNDAIGIAYCLNNLQSIYERIEEYDTALEYLERSLTLIQKTGSERHLAKRYHNIGTIYYRKGDCDKALEYLEKSYEMNKKFNNKSSMASNLNSFGEIYRKQHRIDDALKAYRQSLALYEQLEDKFGISCELRNLGILFKETGDARQAIDYCNRALKLAREIGDANTERMLYGLLSQLFEMLEDYREALDYQKRFKQTNDRILGNEQVSRISLVEARFELDKRAKETEIWKLASVTDYLTKLPNRRGIMEEMIAGIAQVRDRTPFCIGIADIDHFKQFNDRYGHECGDRILVSVAETMKHCLRETARVGRWGGEEFLFLFSRTDRTGAMEIADTIRTAVEKNMILHHSHSLSVTVSIGISQFEDGDTVDDCICKADKALYTAKESGRNTCIVFG